MNPFNKLKNPSEQLSVEEWIESTFGDKNVIVFRDTDQEEDA